MTFGRVSTLRKQLFCGLPCILLILTLPGLLLFYFNHRVNQPANVFVAKLDDAPALPRFILVEAPTAMAPGILLRRIKRNSVLKLPSKLPATDLAGSKKRLNMTGWRMITEQLWLSCRLSWVIWMYASFLTRSKTDGHKAGTVFRFFSVNRLRQTPPLVFFSHANDPPMCGRQVLQWQFMNICAAPEAIKNHTTDWCYFWSGFYGGPFKVPRQNWQCKSISPMIFALHCGVSVGARNHQLRLYFLCRHASTWWWGMVRKGRR